MRVLVTGATGFLGRRLVRALLEAGHEARVVSRDPARARSVLAGASPPNGSVDAFVWDYHAQPFPAEALEGVQAVYHLMGEGIAGGRWTARKKRELLASRIVSTEKLIAALPETCTDFLCASAIGVYPGTTHEPFDETTALPSADTFLTELCAAWEAGARRAESPDRRVVSMRIGLVLGETGMMAPLVPLYRLGLGGPLGDGQQRLPWVHVDDLVAMMLFLLPHRELSGPVNLVGPAPVTLGQFSQTLARVVKRPHLFRVPTAAIRLVLGEAAVLVLASYNVLPKKLEDAGFTFRYTNHEAAIAAVLREHFA